MNLRGVSASYTIVDDLDSWTPPKRIDTYTPSAQIPYHYAIPSGYSFAEKVEMFEWCCKTFGAPGYRVESMHKVWDYQKHPDAKSFAPNARYFYSDAEYFFWFSEEKNLMLFILRWS